MIRLPDFEAYQSDCEAMPKRALRVTLHLLPGSQLAGYDHVFLDNLLAAQVVYVCTGKNYLPNSGTEGYWLPLPLECLWRDGGGYPLWACTPLVPAGQQGEDQFYRHRRRQTGRWTAGKRGRFNITPSDGAFMEMRVPVPTVVADRWEAYCIGNADKIGLLLETVTAVGKERARGFGAVDHWEIESVASFELVHEGQLTRSIPAAMLDEVFIGRPPRDAPTLVSWTPPEWKPELWAQGWPRGTICGMR
jgi:hypothetical protein